MDGSTESKSFVAADAVRPTDRDEDERLLWFDHVGGERRWGGPELRSRSRRSARVAAWVLAALVTAALLRWAWVTWALLDPCARLAGSPEGCVAPPSFFRWLQLAFAVPGIAAGSTVLVYLVHLATSGRTWRRWRGVAISLGALVVAWTAVFVAGRLAI
jgi:hypothetical protein